MKVCPIHKLPLSVPTNKGVTECPECVAAIQARLAKYMETLK